MNYLNASPLPFPAGNTHRDHHQMQLELDSNPSLRIISSSSRSFIEDHVQNQSRYHHQPRDHHQEDANLANIGLELTMWKEDLHHQQEPNSGNIKNGTNNTVKWMSSKMRLMQKMRNPEYPTLSPKRLRSEGNHQKLIGPSSSSSVETDSSSNNLIMSSPIRVCSDCSTTKTPLWRSGPKGPKSLCNACGIRQRKARRAMAEAAANGTSVPPYDSIKLKEKIITSSTRKINGHKPCKAANDRNVDTTNMGLSKSSKLEDFLIKLSNNLAFHRVFPQDEKDAAILLMALSSGLLHG